MYNIQVENYKEFLYQRVRCEAGVIYTKLLNLTAPSKTILFETCIPSNSHKTKGYTAHYVISSESQKLSTSIVKCGMVFNSPQFSQPN